MNYVPLAPHFKNVNFPFYSSSQVHTEIMEECKLCGGIFLVDKVIL